MTGEKEINIWENRVEDYLDDTRMLYDEENISFEVKAAHDLFDIHEFEEVKRKAKHEYEKSIRHKTLIQNLLTDEELSQSVAKIRYKFSKDYLLLSGDGTAVLEMMER